MTDKPPDELPADVLAALRAPAAVDDAVVDRHIEGALAHFDAMAQPGRPAGNVAPVVPLAPRRRAARWIAAAAAVVVVIGGVLLVGRGGGSSPMQTADRAASAAGSAAGSEAKAGAQSAFAPAATSPSLRTPADAPQAPAAGPAAGNSLGAPATYGATEGSTPTCPAPRLRAALMSVGTTVVDGTVRFIYTYVSGPHGEITTTVLVDPTTCART